MAQWWEHSPPTNVARVQIPASTMISGLRLLLVLSFAPRGFSPGTPVFLSPQKPTFPNSNSTRSQVDEETICGCATSKSSFVSFIHSFPFLISCKRPLEAWYALFVCCMYYSTLSMRRKLRVRDNMELRIYVTYKMHAIKSVPISRFVGTYSLKRSAVVQFS